jgi:hypothetical protein
MLRCAGENQVEISEFNVDRGERECLRPHQPELRARRLGVRALRNASG